MESKSDWFTSFEGEVVNSGLSRREIKLYNITRFIRTGRWVDVFSVNCQKCRDFKPTLKQFAGKLKASVTRAENRDIEFEQFNDEICRHLKADHKLIPRSYYLSFYSVIGMLAGTFLGFATGYLIDRLTGSNSHTYLKNGLLLGWFTGLVAGQILGKRKDNKLRKQNRQL